ncbi:hypothetical protein LCGC14_1398340 [marine sediment metagenome]|uniref:Uncharacterized protein n=1 Tax=marine sediment metagenome TaxID=412755 RepID=A0A0F9JXU8_9ZZZZ
MRSTGWEKWQVFCLDLADEVGIDYDTPVPLDIWVADIIKPHVEYVDVGHGGHWMRPKVSRKDLLERVRLADARWRLGDQREKGSEYR